MGKVENTYYKFTPVLRSIAGLRSKSIRKVIEFFVAGAITLWNLGKSGAFSTKIWTFTEIV